MADNAPLWALTRKFVTADVLQEVAAEHAKGRFLLIGTANLDARRPIIWNMGKIASHGTRRRWISFARSHDRLGLDSGGVSRR